MPLPVIADEWQVVLVWGSAVAPRPATNILHFHDTVGTQTDSDLAGDILTNVTGGMWTMVSNTASIGSMNITKLDGTTAGTAWFNTPAARWQGGAAGEPILQGSAVVSLKSAQRGPRGRNRVFLPWIGEDQQANGILTAANVTTTNSAWNTFKTAMATSGWELDAVSGVYDDRHAVSSIVVRPYLKTQRRRARR